MEFHGDAVDVEKLFVVEDSKPPANFDPAKVAASLTLGENDLDRTDEHPILVLDEQDAPEEIILQSEPDRAQPPPARHLRDCAAHPDSRRNAPAARPGGGGAYCNRVRFRRGRPAPGTAPLALGGRRRGGPLAVRRAGRAQPAREVRARAGRRTLDRTRLRFVRRAARNTDGPCGLRIAPMGRGKRSDAARPADVAGQHRQSRALRPADAAPAARPAGPLRVDPRACATSPPRITCRARARRACSNPVSAQTRKSASWIPARTPSDSKWTSACRWTAASVAPARSPRPRHEDRSL